MSAQPHLALVPPLETTLGEPVSPELALIDPELAERARALLDPTPYLDRVGERPIRSVPVAFELPPPLPEPEVDPIEEIVAEPEVVPTEETVVDAKVAAHEEPVVEAPSEAPEAHADDALETAIVPRPVEVARPVRKPVLPAAPPAVSQPVPAPTAPEEQEQLVAEPSTAAAPAPVLPPANGFPVASPPRRSRRRIQGLVTVLVCLALGLVAGLMIADVWAPSLPTVFQEESEPSASPDSASATPATPAPSFPTPPSKTSSGTEPAPPPAGGAGNGKGAPTEPVVNTAFVWVAVPKADRYEIVFEREDRIVYHATTTRTRLELPQSWRLDGKTHRLEPGRYHWTVWPLLDGKRGKPIVSSDYTF